MAKRRSDQKNYYRNGKRIPVRKNTIGQREDWDYYDGDPSRPQGSPYPRSYNRKRRSQGSRSR